MNPESDLTYKAIFDMINLPIIVADSDMSIIFANKSGLTSIGLDAAQLASARLDKHLLFEADELEKMESILIDQHTFHGTCLLTHDEEEVSEFDIIAKPIRLPLKSKLGYYIELHQSQNATLKNDEVVALGGKTSSIAHEISNPLAVLKIHCENFSLLAQKDHIFTNDEVLERMKKLSHATDRITHNNDDLKELSKVLIDQDFNALKTLISNTTSH